MRYEIVKVEGRTVKWKWWDEEDRSWWAETFTTPPNTDVMVAFRAYLAKWWL